LQPIQRAEDRKARPARKDFRALQEFKARWDRPVPWEFQARPDRQAPPAVRSALKVPQVLTA
jgi:hypothetical protein